MWCVFLAVCQSTVAVRWESAELQIKKMKRLLLIAFCLYSFCFLSAQPVIPSDWIPGVGDEWKQVLAPELQEPGEGGANVVWDFSDLSLVGAQYELTYHWLDPEETPYVDSFPDANICADFELSGFGSGFSYSYYRDNGESFDFFGSASQFGSDVYSNPQSLRYIGLEYGTTLEDDYESVRYTNFTDPDTVAGVSTFLYDGYGTLKLPDATIENAVRIYQTDIIYDSTVTAFSADVYADTIISYAWIAEGSVMPVALWQRSVSVSRFYLNDMLFGEDFEGPRYHIFNKS